MQTRLTLLLAACAFTAPSFAQDAPKPPAEIAKFGTVLGKWQGSGTTVREAGGEAIPWTAAMEVTKILDGFFIQQDVQVEVGAPTPIQLRTIYAYDTETKKYVSFSAGNSGPASFHEYFFPERGVLMFHATGMQDGKPVLARGTWKLGRNELTYTSQMAEGAGEMRPYVDGEFQRVESLPQRAVEAAFIEAPVADEMKTLIERMAGTYDVAGTMTMMPGMPEMKITGEEAITSRFGGHALCSIVTGKAEGDDAEYRSESYFTWNAHDACYDVVSFDNMGAVGEAQARWMGHDEMVTTFTGLMQGQPIVAHGVVKFGEHGMTSVVMHSVVGTNPPMKSFTGTYQRHGN